MKKEDPQGATSSGGALGNSRLTQSSRDAFVASGKPSFELVDVSIQVDLPADVINYDSDDETMGRKRFPVFRTKKGIPLYSKEDIREQYCITNKQLHVLETAQARKLFGCIPNQDWKACRRASLLSSCLRKTKSASDDNLANLRPPDNKPLSWEPSPSPGEIQRQSSKLALAVASNSPPSDGDGGFELDRPPVPKSLRQTFDEELANAVLRRKVKLEQDVGTKRHTWAPEELSSIQNGDDLNGDNIFDSSLSSRCPTSRPTLLRLRSQDSGNSDVTSNDSQELDVGRVRMAKTMPNTPDLSHGNRCRRQAKTPELSLDERRQKHVSFDSAALVYGHPAISSTVSGSNISPSPRRPVQSSASIASSKVSPDRKSQERLLDIGCGMKKSESTGFPIGKRHGSVRSLDFISSFTPKVYPNILAKLRKNTKTQATQTEASVTERIAIPAPVLAYLTLSPRAHLQESKTTNTSTTTATTTTATSPSYLTIVPPPPTPPSLPPQQIPSHGKIYGNGKRLTKSRSDSDYRLSSCLSDVKMTVIHLNDSGFQYAKKRHAGRSKSSPATAHQRPAKFQNNGNGQKEIMVTFKPYSHHSNNKNGGGNAYSHKLLKTCSESNVLNGTPYLSGIQAEQKAEAAADIDEVMRERSESDPMLLDTDLVNIEESDNGKDRQRSQSVTHTSAFQFIPSAAPLPVAAAVDDEIETEDKHPHVEVTPKSSLDTTSRESDGGSQYHSLTDQSASSTPTAPLSSRGQPDDEPSFSKPTVKTKVMSSRKRSLDIDVLRLRNDERSGSGVSLDQMTSGAGGGSGSSCDADKTVTYSSDTEYGSIRSEDSHTLMDSEAMDTELKISESQVAAETRPRSERGRPLIIGHVSKRLSVGAGKNAQPPTDGRFLSPKDVLTSPDSEISWSDQPPFAILHSKGDLSHTDSTKSELEGSETSEDYHTATEHSDGIGDTKKRPFLILPPLTLAAHQVTPLQETPESVTGGDTTSHEATEDASYITEIAAIGGGNHFIYNLQSPRSPHASLLSIESSTSGSYTLDSEGNGRKHSSSTICSDSDRELETIFSRSQPPLIQGDIRLKDDVEEVFSHHLEERDYIEEEEDKSATPTPDATLWFSRPRSRTEGNEETDPKRSENNDRCASVENISKSSEVIERSYSFAAIRMKFERMTDSRSRSGSELTKESSRDRSSSVETTTEGASSLTTSESKSGAKRKKPEIAAKPSMIARQLPTAAPIKGHAVTEREYFPSKGESEEEAEDDEEKKFPCRETMPSGGGGDAGAYKKDYRRSISESPEATMRHPEWDVPRSASDAQMDLEQMGLLLGAKPRHHHRSRSHEKDSGSATGHSYRKGATTLKHQHRHVEESVFLSTETAASQTTQHKMTELPPVGGVRAKESKMDRKRSSERRKTTGSYSFDIGDLKSHDDNHRRRERSLPGSTEHLDPDGERRVGVGHSNLSKSLPDRQMELYEMSKILCTECGEKLRKIGDDLSESSGNWSTDPSRSQEMIASGGTGSQFLSVDSGGGLANKLATGSVPEIAVASSTESLQRRSSGGAIDSPGLSSSQGSSMAESSPTSLFPAPHEPSGHEEEDEDIGIYADSYRNSSWIYIGDNEELVVWQGRTTPQQLESTKDLASEPLRREEEAAANLHRTDSLGSTASEKEFRKKYQAVTHRMVHRKSSIEMYKRMSNRTFEIDKTVVVKKVSGEFGFRIHGSRPVVVSAIEPDTAAEACGLEVGDIIIAVNGINVIDASHSEVVKIAHAGCDTLRLDLARTCHILTPVVSAEDMRNPVHCGYLFKQVTGGAAIMQKWCRRWFVLKHDHCLYYFKNELSIEPLGAIMLLNYSVNRAFDVGRSFAFRVTKYGSASYCFAGENEESMNKWANLINQWSTIMGQSDPWIEISTRNLQLPALSIQSPDCHGLLGKMGHRWKSWKKRYCVLKDACMYLYHDINSTTSIGVAHLHGYRMQSCQVQGRKYIFEAIPPEIKMRHYHFYAENDTDRRRWMAAMEYSIDRWIKVG